ncbi:alpha/beta fold hydrolase [Kineococcus sp. LSe6-4]|uniref:Alpha/beta fold hydrolase n=1 Tax=Kineococcus halophytocola TaxID=3234027 RepID=A0ABV4H7L9_9ACTN
MTEFLFTDQGTLAFDVEGEGPLVVLAHGMGDTRRSYRFLAPRLVAAGYRVAALDLRGCGESSTGWDGYSRTDIAGDLVALVRHLGGPAVLVGQSISGGAATIAAATAPDLVAGLVELAPFTRAQSVDVPGLLRVRRYRQAMTRLALAAGLGNVGAWGRYLDLAVPAKPQDWATERARTLDLLREPGRTAAFKAMGSSKPTDAGAALRDVRCPVLVVEGSADPDWADPRAEGERVVADLPAGLGELAVLDGVGHYLHLEAPDAVAALVVPFLQRTSARA